MILLTTIYRTEDGLPLVASTETPSSPEFKMCQKYIKQLSRKLQQLPDRCVLNLNEYCIYSTSTPYLSQMVLVTQDYPAVLAFSFLDEIHREFLVFYDQRKVGSLSRPYMLIHYASQLQKCQQRYNSPQTLSTRLNLGALSAELKLRPPYQVTSGDLELTNGRAGGVQNSYKPTVIPGRELLPSQWYDRLCVMVQLFTIFLNLGRAVALLSHTGWDEPEGKIYHYVTAFVASSLISFFQIYLIYYYSKWRAALSGSALVCQILCCWYVSPIRHLVQIVFHILSPVSAFLVVLCRPLQDKLPDYNV